MQFFNRFEWIRRSSFFLYTTTIRSKIYKTLYLTIKVEVTDDFKQKILYRKHVESRRITMTNIYSNKSPYHFTIVRVSYLKNRHELNRLKATFYVCKMQMLRGLMMELYYLSYPNPSTSGERIRQTLHCLHEISRNWNISRVKFEIAYIM